MNSTIKDTYNKSLIANVNFRIWILNCCGGKIKHKDNTKFNSIKGERVRKIVMWHWRIVMSERNGWFMLYFKNIWLLKSPTVCWNCTELTGINNEEIIYTLLNIFKYRYNTNEINKKGLNSYKKSRLSSVTWFTFKDFISEWKFEQMKKKLQNVFIKTTSSMSLSTLLRLFLAICLKACKSPLWIASSIF